MAGFIGVHLGAGRYSTNSQSKYKDLCKKACRKGVEVLRNGGSSLEAVTLVTQLLEDSPLTNAGYGSNLTWNGGVECDASAMDGHTLQFGAVGAVSGIKNPVGLAKQICEKQMEPLPLGRVQPCLLVGSGAKEWAVENGVAIVDSNSMISKRALKQNHFYKRRVEKYEAHTKKNSQRLDTVGAVSIDKDGHTASACSSGGVMLKHSGRVGQAAIYGSGCWAEDGRQEDGIPSVAVATSGCGEDLIKTSLAKETARALQFSNVPTVSVHHAIKANFLNSPYLKNVKEKLCGVIGLQTYKNENKGVEFLWAHTTQSMCIGYMSTTHSEPKTRMSRLPDGSSIIVEGAFA